MLRRALMGFALWFGFPFGIWPWALLAGLPGLPAGFPPPFGMTLPFGPNVPNKFIFGCGAAIQHCVWNEGNRIYLYKYLKESQIESKYRKMWKNRNKSDSVLTKTRRNRKTRVEEWLSYMRHSTIHSLSSVLNSKATDLKCFLRIPSDFMVFIGTDSTLSAFF